jgi:hypothetical protein
VCDILDALRIAQKTVGLDPQPFDESVADVNGDNGIDIIDALLIAQFYVGIIDALPGCPDPTPPPVKNKCMFVCANDGEENYQYDEFIIPLLESWGYIIDKKHEAQYVANYTAADFLPYDFIFISETTMSDDIKILRNAPLPMLNSDGYTAKELSLGYGPGRPCGFVEPPEPVIFLEEGNGHPLAAGYTPGTVIDLCSTSDLLVWGQPTIPVILIAGLESDPSRLLVYGIEAGTINIFGTTIENKVAMIAVHAFGYETLTEDAVNLYKAGINWILTE